jgi:peptide/nickel transport system permease protein
VIVAVFLVVTAIGPWIVPYPEDARGAVHLERKLQPPGAAHWFGTDEVGNDVYTRVVLGARVSLQIGLVITVIAALIGVPLGIVAGYLGGALGELIMRVTDVFLSVPALILALAVVGALGPGIVNAMLALALVWWPGYVRLVQGKTLALKQETYVEAARAVGTGRLRIVFVHILPNCVSPIVVKASMDMGMAILAAASLGFIGLGAQPPYPEWGAMISHGRNYLPTWWWYSAFPGLAIYLTVLGFNLLGDGLRDLLDPKSRG